MTTHRRAVRATPGQSQGLPPGAPLPPTPPLPPGEAPLSSDQLSALNQALNELGRRLALPQSQTAPIECERRNGVFVDASACLKARNEHHDTGLGPIQAEVVPRLEVVQHSLERELRALPPTPVERALALGDLRDKYRPFTGFSELLGDRAKVDRRLAQPSEPMQRAASNLRGALIAEQRALAADPAVERAWLENRLAIDRLELTFAQRLEWGADRQTLVMQRELKTKLGKKTLFSERSEELEQSGREQSSAGSFSSWGEPTPNEIGLALLRVYKLTGGQQTTPFESQRVGPTPLLAALVKAEVAQVMRVVHVERDGACRKSADRHACPVRVWQKVFARGPGVAALDDGGNGWSRIAKASWDEVERHNGEPLTLVLQPSASGWRAPELVQQLLDADERMRDAMNRPAARAECERRKRAGIWSIFEREC